MLIFSRRIIRATRVRKREKALSLLNNCSYQCIIIFSSWGFSLQFRTWIQYGSVNYSFVFVYTMTTVIPRERTMIKRHSCSLACQCLINSSSYLEDNKIRVDHKVSSVSLIKIPLLKSLHKKSWAWLKTYLRRFSNYWTDI